MSSKIWWVISFGWENVTESENLRLKNFFFESLFFFVDEKFFFVLCLHCEKSCVSREGRKNTLMFYGFFIRTQSCQSSSHFSTPMSNDSCEIWREHFLLKIRRISRREASSSGGFIIFSWNIQSSGSSRQAERLIYLLKWKNWIFNWIFKMFRLKLNFHWR